MQKCEFAKKIPISTRFSSQNHPSFCSISNLRYSPSFSRISLKIYHFGIFDIKITLQRPQMGQHVLTKFAPMLITSSNRKLGLKKECVVTEGILFQSPPLYEQIHTETGKRQRKTTTAQSHLIKRYLPLPPPQSNDEPFRCRIIAVEKVCFEFVRFYIYFIMLFLFQFL